MKKITIVLTLFLLTVSLLLNGIPSDAETSSLSNVEKLFVVTSFDGFIEIIVFKAIFKKEDVKVSVFEIPTGAGASARTTLSVYTGVIERYFDSCKCEPEKCVEVNIDLKKLIDVLVKTYEKEDIKGNLNKMMWQEYGNRYCGAVIYYAKNKKRGAGDKMYFITENEKFTELRKLIL